MSNDGGYWIGQGRSPRKAMMIQALRGNQDSFDMGQKMGGVGMKFLASRNPQEDAAAMSNVANDSYESMMGPMVGRSPAFGWGVRR